MEQSKRRLRLKCRYDGEIRTVIITREIKFNDLKRRLSSDYGFDVSLKYEDRDGDFILLSSQNDMDDLINFTEQDTVDVIVSEAIVLPDLLRKSASKSNTGIFNTSGTLSTSREWQRNSPSSHALPTPSLTSTQRNQNSFRLERFPSINENATFALNRQEQHNIRWKRGEVLGQGAFGIVYLGLNIDTGELMAVKQMATEEVSRRELGSLENEINLLRNLRHPNIVRYIGTEINPTSLSIMLEYVPGGSLRALIDKFGALEESVAKSYTRQLLLGLEYLHRNGIAHRDIKGANCLVGNDGVVKLADFGNSKHWRTANNVNVHTSGNFPALAAPAPSNPTGDGIKGTPAWMSPEVLRDQGGVISWKKADLWSLACTTLEMTTGKTPWCQFNNPVTILYHIATQNTLPEYPNPASVELVTFLNTCLQRDPANRPDITSLLLHPFVSGFGANTMQWGGGGHGMTAARPSTMSSAVWDHGSTQMWRLEPRNPQQQRQQQHEEPQSFKLPINEILQEQSHQFMHAEHQRTQQSAMAAAYASANALAMPSARNTVNESRSIEFPVDVEARTVSGTSFDNFRSAHAVSVSREGSNELNENLSDQMTRQFSRESLASDLARHGRNQQIANNATVDQTDYYLMLQQRQQQQQQQMQLQGQQQQQMFASNPEIAHETEEMPYVMAPIAPPTYQNIMKITHPADLAAVDSDSASLSVHQSEQSSYSLDDKFLTGLRLDESNASIRDYFQTDHTKGDGSAQFNAKMPPIYRGKSDSKTIRPISSASRTSDMQSESAAGADAKKARLRKAHDLMTPASLIALSVGATTIPLSAETSSHASSAMSDGEWSVGSTVSSTPRRTVTSINRSDGSKRYVVSANSSPVVHARKTSSTGTGNNHASDNDFPIKFTHEAQPKQINVNAREHKSRMHLSKQLPSLHSLDGGHQLARGHTFSMESDNDSSSGLTPWNNVQDVDVESVISKNPDEYEVESMAEEGHDLHESNNDLLDADLNNSNNSVDVSSFQQKPYNHSIQNPGNPMIHTRAPSFPAPTNCRSHDAAEVDEEELLRSLGAPSPAADEEEIDEDEQTFEFNDRNFSRSLASMQSRRSVAEEVTNETLTANKSWNNKSMGYISRFNSTDGSDAHSVAEDENLLGWTGSSTGAASIATNFSRASLKNRQSFRDEKEEPLEITSPSKPELAPATSKIPTGINTSSAVGRIASGKTRSRSGVSTSSSNRASTSKPGRSTSGKRAATALNQTALNPPTTNQSLSMATSKLSDNATPTFKPTPINITLANPGDGSDTTGIGFGTTCAPPTTAGQRSPTAASLRNSMSRRTNKSRMLSGKAHRDADSNNGSLLVMDGATVALGHSASGKLTSATSMSNILEAVAGNLDFSTDSLDNLQITGTAACNNSGIGAFNTLTRTTTATDSLHKESAVGAAIADGFDGSDDHMDSPASVLTEYSPMLLNGHSGAVTRLRAPLKTSLLLSSSTDGTVILWDGEGERKAVLDANNFSTGGNNTASDSRPERKISLGTKTNHMSSLDDNDSIGGDPGFGVSSARNVKILNMWSEDSCEMIWASCSDGAIRVWSGHEGRGSRVLRGHEEAVTAMEGVDEIGGVQPVCLMGTGSADRTVRIWDARAKRAQVFLFRGHTDTILSLRWGEGGRTLMSAGKDKSIRLWDTRAGRLRVTLEKHFGAVNSLRAMQDSSSRALAGTAAPGTAGLTNNNNSSSSNAKESAVLVSGGRDAMINLWTADGDCVGTQSAHRGSLSFLSDINYRISYKQSTGINVAPLIISLGADNIVKIWDLKRLRTVSEIPVSKEQHGLCTKAVWCGQSIITASSTGSLRLFDQCNSANTADGSNYAEGVAVTKDAKSAVDWTVKELPSHAQACTDLVCTDAMVASSSRSGQIYRWNL